jgi:capsular exopolysaccharide synthesis family protein
MNEAFSQKRIMPSRKVKPEWDIWDLVHLLVRNRRVFALLIPAALATASVEHFCFPSFKVKASLLVQEANNNPLQAVSAKLSGLSGDEKESTERYLAKLRSFDYFLTAANSLKESSYADSIKADVFAPKWKWIQLAERTFDVGDHKKKLKQLSTEAVAQTLMGWVTFGREGADSIAITVETPEHDLSLLLTNILSEAASSVITDYKLRELNEAEKYVDIELAKSETAIRETGEEIGKYRQVNQSLASDGGKSDASVSLNELQRGISEAEVERDENSRVMESLKIDMRRQQQEIDQDTGRSPASTEDPTFYKYGVAQKIKSLMKKNEFLTARLASLKKYTAQTLNSYNQSGGLQVFDLHKKLELQYSLYQELKKQSFTIQMMRISSRNKVTVLDKVRNFDVHTSYGLSVQLMMALFLALFSGGLFAYTREIAIPIVDRKQDLEAIGMTFLGNIPEIGSGPAGGDRFRKGAYNIDSPLTMSFRHIRARIMHYCGDSKVSGRKIAILSGQQGEGKSFVSRNLADCLAHMKKKVLIIDCDLRAKQTSVFYGFEKKPGLGEILTSQNTVEEFDTVVQTQVAPGIDVLPSGNIQENVTELIASDAFLKLLESLQKRYEFILLDTPAVNCVPDAPLIAQSCDMLIFVAAYNRTSQDQLRNAVDNIVDLAPKPIYAVLNQVTTLQEGLYLTPRYRRRQVKPARI